MRYIIMLLVLAATVPVAAQKIIYVAYDKARLYSEPDYLSEVVDTLAIGDQLSAFERRAKFTHVRSGDAEGWVLTANVSEKAPAAIATPRSAASGDGAATSASGSDEGAAMSASGSDEGAAAIGAGDASNAGKTVIGKASQASGDKQRRTPSRSTTAPSAESRQCSATTKSGRQCSRRASSGSAYCWQHNR